MEKMTKGEVIGLVLLAVLFGVMVALSVLEIAGFTQLAIDSI